MDPDRQQLYSVIVSTQYARGRAMYCSIDWINPNVLHDVLLSLDARSFEVRHLELMKHIVSVTLLYTAAGS